MKRKARQRIEEAADRLACELLKMATNDKVADSVKLAAIRDGLDRAGLAGRTAVEVEGGPPKPYEAILERIEAGSRAEYRRSVGRTDDSNSEYSPPLAEFRELPAADAYHVVDDFTVAIDELGMANDQGAQPKSGGNRNKQKRVSRNSA